MELILYVTNYRAVFYFSISCLYIHISAVFLECDAVYFGEYLHTFRRHVLTKSSRSKYMSNKQQVEDSVSLLIYVPAMKLVIMHHCETLITSHEIFIFLFTAMRISNISQMHNSHMVSYTSRFFGLVHKNSQLGITLTQINQTNVQQSHLSISHFNNIFHLRPSLPSSPLSSRFSNISMQFSSLVQVLHVLFIFLHLLITILLGKEC